MKASKKEPEVDPEWDAISARMLASVEQLEVAISEWLRKAEADLNDDKETDQSRFSSRVLQTRS